MSFQRQRLEKPTSGLYTKSAPGRTNTTPSQCHYHGITSDDNCSLTSPNYIDLQLTAFWFCCHVSYQTVVAGEGSVLLGALPRLHRAQQWHGLLRTWRVPLRHPTPEGMGVRACPAMPKPPGQEMRHLLQVATENNIMVFSFLNRRQELPTAAEQRKEGKPASPAHQPHHLSAPERCLHGLPVPGMGQQRGDAAGLAGGQPGAQGVVGHHRGPRGGVEGRPHHLAELRHGVPGKMLGEGVLGQAGVSSIFISVFQSQGPFIIRECGCFHCVSRVTIVTKRHCLLFRECLSSAQTWAFVQPVAFYIPQISHFAIIFPSFIFILVCAFSPPN